MNRTSGRRKEDRALALAQLAEMGAQTFSTADMFRALDSASAAVQALDAVAAQRAHAPTLRAK